MTSKIPLPTLEELDNAIAWVEREKFQWKMYPDYVRRLDAELYCLYAVRDGVKASNALLDFFTWAMNEGPFDGCSLDGGDVQDKAENLGLIVSEKYDPEVHGARCDFEEGDDIYVFSPNLMGTPVPIQSPWMDIETAPRDGVSSEQLRLECCAVLSRFVDQIDRTNMVDDHGHNFKMNKDFLDAKALIEGPRDYRVCYHHISNPTNRTSYPMQEPLLTYAEAEKEVAEQKAKSWAVAWIIARDGLVARTPPTHNSPPDVSTSHNHGEGDPSVMPDSSGGEA